ncbi:MAG TPA: metallophosphoesterase family protein, partial [Limnochordia bacterium]|nr:metallophosphoesterase family protein [Limnochordia bacterium]
MSPSDPDAPVRAAAAPAATTFAVLSQGPRKPQEELELAEFLRGAGDVDFLVHTGGMVGPESIDPSGAQARVAALCTDCSRPIYALPGSSEWGRAENLAAWRRGFLGADRPAAETAAAHDDPTGIRLRRQPAHPENFAFVHKRTAFVGIDLPGTETPARAGEWETATELCAAWLEAQLDEARTSAGAAVVFLHAFPSRYHAAFSAALQRAAKAFARPVLVVHGEGVYHPHDRLVATGPRHTRPVADESHWRCDRPRSEGNLLRLQVERFGDAPPPVIRVHPEALEPFAIDRRYQRGPYLTMGTPHGVTLIWRLGRRIEPVVRYGLRPEALERRLAAKAIATKTHSGAEGSGRLHSAPDDAWQYEATFTELEPGTRYYYAVYDGERKVLGGDPDHHFRTSPPPGSHTPFRFWTFGDSGRNNQAQYDVQAAMRRYTAADGRPLDLFLHCGDMAYSSGTDWEFQGRFFKPYAKTLRQVVLWPTMSNHEGVSSDGATDTGPYYDAFVLPTEGQAGGVPSGTESFFSFEYANAHFVCLNTYAVDLSPEAPMARWLVADLAAAQSERRADWIIAYWHHSPYTKGSHDSDTEAGLIDVRAQIMPLLEAGGVDLIFNGHSHVYERSMLMDGAYGTPTSAERCILDDGDGDPAGNGPYRKSRGLRPHEGTVVVVVGCGGTPVARRGTMPVMRRVLSENGSVLVDVDGETLTAVMVNAAGEVRDRFQIVKRGRMVPRPLEQPFQLPAFIDYARHPARLRFERTPVDGLAAAELQIPPLPDGAGIARAATLSWHCTGTDWRAEPERLQIELSPSQAVRQTVQAGCGGRVFPLPEARLTYHTA